MPTPTLTFDQLDSTMLEAGRQATAGARGPLVICARVQTGGHGRHGRNWASPAGNLYWTMLLDGQAERPRDAGMAFAAGLAVMDALGTCGVPAVRLRLKWPNDVLLDSRKLAGLLIEASLIGKEARIIVGIGINVASSPPDALFPAISLGEAGLALPPLERLRDALTDALLVRRAEWQRHGLAPLLERAAAVLHGVGESQRVALDRDRTRIVCGINEGLGSDGALLLRTPDGTRHAIVAGDVLA
ncbi:MAG: biotin--[acetyl-CoA-carboxylase] ligase [Acetobacteraceae bacterium]|nr:biotin--[acetyl-CoA-carboxylase] ligase [Acetobacteraceae bacterium]